MSETGIGRPIEILLVEDNAGDARLAQEALNDAKVRNHITWIKDGVEAIAYLRGAGQYKGSTRPDVILLDLNLPKMDGREVLADIKADKELRRIPVVVLTVSEAEEDVLKSYNLHANCYIKKPLDLDQFLTVVKAIENFWLTIVKLPQMEKHIRILLVEDNPGDAVIVRELLRESDNLCELTTVTRIRDCIRLIDDKLVDMILLDLTLPDSSGLEGLQRLRAQAPEIPIIILTGLADIDTAEKAVRSGAQDYLVKGQLEGNLLSHAVRFAQLRHAFRSELEELSLRDPLTGLYNRRGFRLLADQSLRLARRNSRDSILLLADMNDLKEINDTHGHAQGDLALQAAARAFTTALRDSDIVARLGGDEFVALAVEAHPPGITPLMKRVDEQIQLENGQLAMSHPLSLSIGVAAFNPKEAPSLNDLIVAADRDMYEQKKTYRQQKERC